MTTAISATPRSNSTALQTRRAPRTKSYAAKPEGDTSTVSPAARLALASEGSTQTAEPTAEPPRTPLQKAYG